MAQRHSDEIKRDAVRIVQTRGLTMRQLQLIWASGFLPRRTGWLPVDTPPIQAALSSTKGHGWAATLWPG